MNDYPWQACVLERLTAIQGLLIDILKTSRECDETKKARRQFEADKARWDLERQRDAAKKKKEKK